MNKSQLIDSYATHSGVPATKAQMILDALINKMSEELVHGNRIEVRGFGTFSVRKFGAKVARNPKTGEPVKIASSTRVYYRVGKELKASLIKSKDQGVPIQKD